MGDAVIIVAGGSGKRMGAAIPKQFLLLKGRPVLCHTIERFSNQEFINEIIVVLPADHIAEWERLQKKHQFQFDGTVVSGGKERFHSVKNGLEAVTTSGVVGVHDGVRPLVSDRVIRDTYEAARSHEAAVPVVPVDQSMRKRIGNDSEAVNRSDYVLVQTPQCFRAEVLKKAYKQPYSNMFTDDASVVEKASYSIELVSGDPQNIKLTHPADIQWAEIWMSE